MAQKRKIVVLRKHEWLVESAARRRFEPAAAELVKRAAPGKGVALIARHAAPLNRARTFHPSEFVATVSAQPDQYVMPMAFEDDAAAEQFRHENSALVQAVYADLRIGVAPYCGGSAVGTSADVARLLGVPALGQAGLDGRGTRIVIVDTGIAAGGSGAGREIRNVSKEAWHPTRDDYTGGSSLPDHGTMCAFNAQLVAPAAEIVDYALLQSDGVSLDSWLSDAIMAFSEILEMRKRFPGRIVVSNSWAVFDTSEDEPLSSPGHYGGNPTHPFNDMVHTVAAAGIDIVFAAGNCGAECPDGRCGASDRGSGRSIIGANGHPDVITVAAVTVERQRLGYSSQGPAKLSDAKPNVCGYAHHSGSGVRAVDAGTSTACPVVAGVVAALRTREQIASPAEIRAALQKSALDLGTSGFDHDHGYGVVQPVEAAKLLGLMSAGATPPTPAPPVPAPPVPAPPPPPRSSAGAGLSGSEIEMLDDRELRFALADRARRPALDQYFGPAKTAQLEVMLQASTRTDRAAGPARTVILLPGILGSGLRDEARFIPDLLWVDIAQLALGDGLDLLALDDDGRHDRSSSSRVMPTRPLRLFYDLLRFDLIARARVHVEPFAYDWRKGIDVSARELRNTIERLAAGRTDAQFSIVAHSMGGLVARRYAQLFPSEADGRISHAVFIAPPLAGSFAPAEVLSGEHDLIDRFDIVLPGAGPKLRRSFRTFRGFYELLPDPDLFECRALFDPATWGSSALTGLLADAEAFGMSLRGTDVLRPKTSIILGANRPTTGSVQTNDGRLQFHANAPGDGTVPASSAWSPGAMGHYLAHAEHSTMPLDADIREGVAWLVTTDGQSAGPLERSSACPVAVPMNAPVAASFSAPRIGGAALAPESLTGERVMWLLGSNSVPDAIAADRQAGVGAPTASRPEAAMLRADASAAARGRGEDLLSPDELTSIYRAFALEAGAAPIAEIPSRYAASPVGSTSVSLEDAVTRQAVRVALNALDYQVPDATEPPPLSAQQLGLLRRLHASKVGRSAVRAILKLVLKRGLLEGKISESSVTVDVALDRVMDDAGAVLAAGDPAAVIRARQAASAAIAAPPDFEFDDYDAAIPAQPQNYEFETVTDLLGWLVFTAGPALMAYSGRQSSAPFRLHETVDSGFTYNLPAPTAEKPTSIAVFADFGTGVYHSRYIARQIAKRKPAAAIHLGDVYYAGRRSEFDRNFEQPLAPILGQTDLYLLAGNHEMYSGGFNFMRYLDAKRAAHANVQKQEGPYFRLLTPEFQLIGLDTEWEGHGRVSTAQRRWLELVLQEARSKDRVNILFTSSHPYTYGDDAREDLHADLSSLIAAGDIALWFWGNTHYAALFHPNAQSRFIGTCVGHGGYPFDKIRAGLQPPEMPRVEWLETADRFGQPGMKPNGRGNNGYCELQLFAGPSVRLVYWDWMGNMRCTRDLVWDSQRRALSIVTP
jgi:hypothetical protein